MQFCELTEEEFKNFSSEHSLRSFLQTPEMAIIKRIDNWNYYYVGVKQDKKVLCATLLLEYKGRHFKTFSSPRGYLIDYRDKELLKFFTKEIKKFIKKKGGSFLNIEPNVLYKERDIDGQIVSNGFDNSDIYQNLIKLNYKHNGFYLNLDASKQCRWEFILDISDKSEDEVFNNFKPNTRNVIRKNIKYGVYVRELAYNELDKFYDLVQNSGERHDFHSRSVKYYQSMYNVFHDKGMVKFLVTELVLDNYISTLKSEISELKDKISSINNNNHNKGRYEEFKSQIQTSEDRINEALKLKDKYGDKVIMAGAMFMLYGTEIVYLFSGTRNDFLTLKSQFLLQWHIIKYGIDNGYKIYNFGGISGILNKSDARYGLYIFKKSFGGNVIEYIGDFDLIVSPVKYSLRKILEKIGGR